MWINKLKQQARKWRGVLVIAPTTAILVIGLRSLAWLQSLEWATIDTYFQLRPPEPTDNKFLIVGIEESDIQKLKEYPVSDEILAKALTKIKAQKPRVIGLDIYRDIPKPPGSKELTAVFKSTPNLIGIQKVIGDSYSGKIAPPPVLKQLNQVAAADMVVDGDGVIRRGVLFPGASNGENLPSLGLAMAVEYLKAQGVLPKADKNGWLKLNQTSFVPFEKNDGGYVRADAGGYQILLNYRGSAQSFLKVSLTDVLEDKVAPSLMRDRIVIIGASAPSLNDSFLTPYSRGSSTTPISTPGVEIQANLASSITKAVTNNRPLINVWSDFLENIWIICWIVLVSVIAWHWGYIENLNSSQFFIRLTLLGLFTSSILIIVSYGCFLLGWWIPVVPPLIGILLGTIALSEYLYINKLEDSAKDLANKVKLRTQELEKSIGELKAAQQQIIAQQKLSAIGTLTLGVTHELRNPLQVIINYTEFSLSAIEDLLVDFDNFQNQILLANDFTNYQFGTIEGLIIYLDVFLGINNCLTIYYEQLKAGINEVQNNLNKVLHKGGEIDKILTKMIIKYQQENGRVVVNNLSSLIEEAINLGSQSIKLKDVLVKVETDFDSSIQKISIYPQQLICALTNIIDNAFAAATSSTKCCGEDFVPTVKVKTRNSSDIVSISIENNGDQIPNTVLEQIFDPFFTTKPLGEGLGLGLHIAQEIIVRAHQGKVLVDTNPEFTIFILEIPKILE